MFYYKFILIVGVIFCIAHSVQGIIPPRVKYHHAADVPFGEHLVCRHPKDYDEIKKTVDLRTQQKNTLRCDLKHYTEVQRPCDFRKVNRYKLTTITVGQEHAHDDIRCWMDPKLETLHIEDATLRDVPIKMKFNVYTIREPKK